MHLPHIVTMTLIIYPRPATGQVLSKFSINGLKVSINGLITEQVLVLEGKISLPNDSNAHLYYRQSFVSAD